MSCTASSQIIRIAFMSLELLRIEISNSSGLIPTASNMFRPSGVVMRPQSRSARSICVYACGRLFQLITAWATLSTTIRTARLSLSSLYESDFSRNVRALNPSLLDAPKYGSIRVGAVGICAVLKISCVAASTRLGTSSMPLLYLLTTGLSGPIFGGSIRSTKVRSIWSFVERIAFHGSC